MRTSLVAALVLGSSSLVISATPLFADSYTLKCNAQKDTVWVYDAVDTLNVQAKLSCGQSVEVLARANGYARIHAANGVEGFIPEGDFANLPSVVGRRDAGAAAPAGASARTTDVASAAKAAQAREMAQYAAQKNSFAGAPPAKTAGGASAPATVAKSSAPAGVASYQYAEMAPRVAPAPAASSPAAPAATRVTVTEVAAPAPDEALKSAPVVTVDEASKAAAPAASVAGVSAIGDGSCRSYYSAYGLTTNQLKWIEQNRSKQFSGVCPSPDLEHVNFVMIFTHDVDFYSATMPTRVHSAGGFSDFQPMTTVDNALMSESEANKARHEYVWVFQMGQGAFDPNTFSTHRASQFTKEESNGLGGHGSQKAVEDAFHYIEGASSR
jgi:hypothetical protein